MSRKKLESKDFSGDSLGGRIGLVRTEHGQTQEEFAINLGISPSTVNTWEKNRHTPNRSAVQLISEKYCVSKEWLLTGKGPRELSDASILQTMSPEILALAFEISRLTPEQRQTVSEVVQQFLKVAQTAPGVTPKPEPAPPPASTYTLRSGNVIDLDGYRRKFAPDVQAELTDEEVAQLAQFEETVVQKGVMFHGFELEEMFTFSASRLRELIKDGQSVGLC